MSDNADKLTHILAEAMYGSVLDTGFYPCTEEQYLLLTGTAENLLASFPAACADMVKARHEDVKLVPGDTIVGV